MLYELGGFRYKRDMRYEGVVELWVMAVTLY